MLADPDGIIERATNALGERRFYPPNAHPATHRLREHLFALERLRDEMTNPPEGGNADLEQAIQDLEEKLRRFERGEDMLKAQCLLDESQARGWRPGDFT